MRRFACVITSRFTTPPWRNAGKLGSGGRSASGTVSSPRSSATSAASTRIRPAGRSPPSRPPCGAWIRRWPRSTAAARQDSSPATRGLRPWTGGTLLSGPRTATAAGGNRTLAGCISRASGTSRSTPTAPSRAADILASKAEEAGRRIVFVDPRNTSITCHQCGNRCLRPCQALVICPVHGGMDADVNGAKNIYTRAGLGSGQAATAA